MVRGSTEHKQQEVSLENANKSQVYDERKQARVFQRLFTNWWMWEILSLLWGIIGVLIIVALLLVYNNRPQSDWSGSISLNSLVALLTTVAKLGFVSANTAALGQLRWNWYSSPRPLGDWVTFDQASRGSPSGSASLMWKIRGLHLAPIGAFVSLAAIFFSSLTQQALVFVQDSGTTQAQENAILSRSFSYSAETTRPFSVVDGSPTTFIAPSNTKMLAAVAFVAFNASSNVEPGFGLGTTCSTGTCLFDVFSSLAACSQCDELDEVIDTDCSSGTCVYRYTSNNTLSESATLRTGNVLNTTNNEPIYTTLNVSSTTGLGDDFGVFNYISLFTNYTSSPTSNNINLASGNTSATRCHISLCVKTFNASILNGTYQETVLNQTLLSSANLTLNGTIMELPIPLGNLPANATLFISPGSLEILGRSIQTFYSGAVVIAPGQGDGAINTSMLSSYGFGYTSNSLQGLFNNNTVNLTSAAENTATTITNILRSQGPPEDLLYGKAYLTQSYLRVNWAWIIYPAGLEFLVAVFLAATILKTRNSGVQNTWKSSPLALLFHGLEGSEGALRNMNELGKLSEMGAMSGKVRVKLKRTEQRTRLVCARGQDSDQESEGEGEAEVGEGAGEG